MDNYLIKILCFSIFFGISFTTFSQDAKKFGYHDRSGNVKDINTKEIEEKRIRIIPDNIIDTIPDSHQQDLWIRKLDSVNNILDVNTFVSEMKDTIRISVLLPLHVDRNRSWVQFLKENKQDTNQIYRKSKTSLSLLAGVKLAVDSLSNMSIPIKLHVFDILQ